MKNIILKPLKETQAVTVLVLVKVGSRYENDTNQGVAHFIEHLLFKGTKKRPNSLAITRQLDSIGAEYNAFTSKDRTGFYIKTAKENLELAVEILADMIFNSKFDIREINRERGVVIEEINMYLDNPLMFIDSFLEESVFKGYDLGRQIIGTKEVISKIKRSEIIKFYRRYYRPQNLVVGIAGNFIESQAQKLLQRYFSIQQFKQKNSFRKFNNRQSKARISLKEKNTDQINLSLGFSGLSYNDPDYYAGQLLAIILGGNMSSRLFIKIREKLGLCYYIRAHSEAYQDTGIFSIIAGLDSNKTMQALKEILKEINRIKTKSISVTELKRAQSYIRGHLTIKLEDSSNIIAWYVDQLVLRNKQLDLNTVLDNFNKVKTDDIFRVANKIFKNSKLNLAVIGPSLNRDKLENIISLSLNNNK